MILDSNMIFDSILWYKVQSGVTRLDTICDSVRWSCLEGYKRYSHPRLCCIIVCFIYEHHGNMNVMIDIHIIIIIIVSISITTTIIIINMIISIIYALYVYYYFMLISMALHDTTSCDISRWFVACDTTWYGQARWAELGARPRHSVRRWVN